MPSDKGLEVFPDVQAKLQKPTKQSAFEKQKAEAEAKRLREEAETAAVYHDFVKSFDQDDNRDEDFGSRRGGFGGTGRPGGPRPGLGGPPPSGTSRRHFGSSNLKSGPGSLGPAPASFGKKRSFQDFSRGHRDRDDQEKPSSVSKILQTSDDEEDMAGATDKAEEKATARPTIRMTNLPSGTSPAVVKSLIPDNLTVEDVKIQPSYGHGSSERKSLVAIVTLSRETPANKIDGAVSALQNKYLGYGHYLSLHRHLSSAVASTSALTKVSAPGATSHPFSAKPVDQQSEGHGRQRDHNFQRGFAPPTNYNQVSGNVGRGNLFFVPVKPPGDIRTVQIINKVIEGVLHHGSQYEVLLLSRPEVQREEKWAWIWDARSTGGVWYRWKLWEIVTGSRPGRSKGKYLPLFEDSNAWKTPDERLAFEYTTKIDEFISDSEYNSSDSEDFDGELNRENPGDENGRAFLNPLEKAKLTHLLARLPPSISKLRNGDIARVTTFAITHASRGVDEVVDMMVSNLERPFSLTRASRAWKSEVKDTARGDGPEESNANDGADASAATLVALYAVSDILSSSSSSGVRHAWRFRQLFEVALEQRKVFEHLGLMAEKYGWGRMRAEKWKRSVNLVLGLWDGWSVFAVDKYDLFVSSFENPPSAKVGGKSEDDQKKGKWKPVEKTPAQVQSDQVTSTGLTDSKHHGDSTQGEPPNEEDVIGEPLNEADILGEPLNEDDILGEPLNEEDIMGEPLDEDEEEGEPIDEDGNEQNNEKDNTEGPLSGEDDLGVRLMEVEEAQKEGAPQLDTTTALTEREEHTQARGETGSSSGKGPNRKPRMRAVDMFADSDSEGGQ